MRSARNLSLTLKLERMLRGYRPLPARPARMVFEPCAARVPAGGVITGPFGARSRAIDTVRFEIFNGQYVTAARLATALERLIARL